MSGFAGYSLLSHIDNAAGASATIDSATFDLYNFLRVYIRIAGYSGGGGVAQLRFNGDAGTTAYSYAVQEFTGAATPVATGASAVAATAAGIKVAVTSFTSARALIVFDISNVAAQAHGIVYLGSSGSLVAATAPVSVLGSGIWATTNRIIQISLEGGGVNLLAGSSLDVYGIT